MNIKTNMKTVISQETWKLHCHFALIIGTYLDAKRFVYFIHV